MKVPPGWDVTYNDFTTADPSDPEAPDWLFREDLFQAHILEPVERTIDLGWYSDRSKGSFKIICVEPDFRGVVLEEVRTRSILEAVEALNRMFVKATFEVYGG